MPNDTLTSDAVVTVNGVALHRLAETLSVEDLRQRACTELLRQAAQDAGLLGVDDESALDGAVSEAATEAIDRLIEQQVVIPEPSIEACRRHYDANQAAFRVGERVQARHILFAVTPGIDVVALRKRAEIALLDVRCHGRESDNFAEVARGLSNCPSGAAGGELGWLEPGDCAPEFARELFGHAEIGVLPRLVHSRFGLHVVEVLAREPGLLQPFESVQHAVAQSLRQRSFVTALRQYLRLLAGAARLEGVDLDGAETPLVR